MKIEKPFSPSIKKNYIKIKFLTAKGTSDTLTKKHEELK